MTSVAIGGTSDGDCDRWTNRCVAFCDGLKLAHAQVCGSNSRLRPECRLQLHSMVYYTTSRCLTACRSCRMQQKVIWTECCDVCVTPLPSSVRMMSCKCKILPWACIMGHAANTSGVRISPACTTRVTCMATCTKTCSQTAAAHSSHVHIHAIQFQNMQLAHRSSAASFKNKHHHGGACIASRCTPSAHSAARMATLQPQQLDEYFSRIQAPSEGRSNADSAADLSLLRRLILQHQRSIPFENLSLVRQT